ncbi:unnamed protein product [Rotaria socialis]|uniref:Uncharacterized protein n=1 Tax=Rotaria socialis TaxID=392032 RepID=A0A818BDK7_9BILA|nr:unnamed protein product [Rotaria socialis]CAF3382240.1 unnamed protein product [Rotaria socialis]CAF3399535.1 unnamed protein product [Rotaria socialis]CAF3418499.1 unnamed protein product [Rotaria socialis]CAF3787714.1 unnamed protein product [Rotaria socialis]
MDDIDGFTIVDELGSSNEQTYEMIDVDDTTENDTNTKKPITPSAIVPPVVSKTLADQIPEVVQQHTPHFGIKSPESKLPDLPIKTITPITLPVEIQKTVPLVIPPVPPLPRPPVAQRYGDAAFIPHSLDQMRDLDDIINTSRNDHQNTLNASIRQQQKQQRAIQTTFEDMATGSAFSNVLKAKEDLQKSPEQLEQEKRSIIAQRVPALNLDGNGKEDLIEKAKQFHNLLQQLHGAIYELTERFERQKYDMVELTERARQIEKGKAKTRKSNIVHTGLGGGIFAGVNDVTAKAPAKVSLFSRYERLTDRRTYKDRRDVFAVPKPSTYVAHENVKGKISLNAPAGHSSRKPKQIAKKHESEEKQESSPPPAEEEPAEEPAAEEPAPEEPEAEGSAAEEEAPAAEEEEE